MTADEGTPAPPDRWIDPEVEAYIASVPADQRPIFDRLHRLVLDTLPDARVTMSYKMPAYVVTGGRISLSAGKSAVSLATTVAEPVTAFKAKHPRFTTGKVTVKFPPGTDLPDDDLRTLVRDATGSVAPTRPVISHVSLCTVWVTDQDLAKRFYIDKLGFVEDTDTTTADGHRWLTVTHPARPDLRLTLMRPGPPLDHDDAATITRLLDKGSLGPIGLATDDCHATYQELTARGVEFLHPPAQRPYGIEAVLRDPCGNWLAVVEPSPDPSTA